MWTMSWSGRGRKKDVAAFDLLPQRLFRETGKNCEDLLFENLVARPTYNGIYNYTLQRSFKQQ
jgi:hypothetical protein